MDRYHIYHPKGGLINHACVRGQYEYEFVGTVLASSLDQAFVRAQNDFEPWAEYQVRSTCIGDIITCPSKDVGVFPTCYMVKGVGFTEVPHAVISYIDWGNHLDYSMTKTQFYRKYGGLLVEVAKEDLEYGNHLILYPEEVEKAQQLQREGKHIYTLYEESGEGEEETVKKGLDSGTYVVGYYAVNNPE